ncbi:MAG: hypothetical protein M1818_005024 [Claussenomyces sp. TS43310]|nr:MAG: hypothetical protein M1818_005024 [Claussenomyces sp. TS43310]
MGCDQWEAHMHDLTREDERTLQLYHEDEPRLFSSEGDELEILTDMYGSLVSQQFSFGRFGLSAEAFNSILAFEKVFPPYLEAVRAFGSKLKDNHNNGVGICGHIYESASGTDQIIPYGRPPHFLKSREAKTWTAELCYNIPYPALNGRNRGSPWSERLTGVYHQVNLQTSRSCWILLQASAYTRRRVQEALKIHTAGDGVSQNPTELHLILLSSTETQWSEYIEYLDARLDDLDEKACFSRVGKQCHHDYSVTFSDYQRLHLLRQKLLKASADLATCRDIAVGLETRYKDLKDRGMTSSRSSTCSHSLAVYMNKIVHHQRAISSSLQRLKGTAALLNKILEFRDIETLRETNRAMQLNLATLQHIAVQTQRENETLSRIAKQNRKDSMKLKALTLIATVYLPATLLATIFSSSLISAVPAISIDGKEIGAHFSIFRQFWVYVLGTFALTGVTLAAFLFMNHRWRKQVEV